jgi:hypothetical protein
MSSGHTMTASLSSMAALMARSGAEPGWPIRGADEVDQRR